MSRKKRKKSRQAASTAKPLGLNSSTLIIAGGVALIGIAALLIFGSGGGSTVDPSFTPEMTGQPALRADQERIDLGNVRLGQTVSASFQLTNVGDQPLFFTESPYVEVAAGC